MNEIEFSRMLTSEQAAVSELIRQLYNEDYGNAEGVIATEKIQNTFIRIATHPDQLRIDVFKINNRIIGYALLFNFWSNEYGGLILNLDELFIIPEYRDRGIATKYIKKLEILETRYVALSLEVLPNNKKALGLYKRLGFLENSRKFLQRKLK